MQSLPLLFSCSTKMLTFLNREITTPLNPLEFKLPWVDNDHTPYKLLRLYHKTTRVIALSS